MPVEIELRFRADGPAPLRALATSPSLGEASLGRARTIEEVDRYLETDDRRFAAARWACRLRTREGVSRISLKGPPEPGSGTTLHRRPEVEGPGTESTDPAAWPPSEARELVERLRAGRPLEERVRLRQQRTERPVVVDGRQLGTLTLDTVGIEAGGRSLGELHVVEIELRSDGDARDEASLVQLTESLASLPGLEPEPFTKLERALERLPGS